MRALSLALLLVGCGSDPSGIWLLTYPVDGAGAACSDQTGENFFYGQWPIDDGSAESAWTYEESATYPDELGFAQIETTADDGAVLIIGATVLPGALNKKSGVWLFSWSAETSESSSETHSAGYTYSEWNDSSSLLEIRFTMSDDDHADGSVNSSTVSRTTWTETDVWDYANTGVNYGQTPSSSYLDASDGSGTAIENTSSAADCEDATCTLWFQTTCDADDTFTAVRADFEGDDVYGDLANVSDPS